MQSTSFQRFRTRRVPLIFAAIDLVIPTTLLFIIHILFSQKIWSDSHSFMALISGALFVISTAVQGGYSLYSQRSIAKKLEITFKTWLFNVFLMLVLSFFFLVNIDFSRSIMTAWVLLTPFIVLFLKLQVNKVAVQLSQRKIQVAVLGRHYEFNEFEYSMLEQQGMELSYFSLSESVDLEEKILSISPDYLLLNLESPATNTLVKDLTHLDLKGVRLIVLHRFMEAFLRKCYIPYESEDLSYLEKVRSYSLKNYLAKRFIDWLAVLLLGLVTLPVMVFSVIKIKKESPGSTFFKQSRVGLGGENFMAVKFRSMHENAKFNPYTQAEDPRIFPWGNFMRKSRVDELPQLWNVAKGDMHLLGPRTEWDILVAGYEKEIPYYHERHLVRPGISGWAQVLYPYGANTEDARQKLMYDLYYIKHWSIWLELETIIRTVGVVLGKKGL